jgi:hypothetical protein
MMEKAMANTSRSSRWFAIGKIRYIQILSGLVMALHTLVWAVDSTWVRIPSMPGLSSAEDSVFHSGLSGSQRCPTGPDTNRFRVVGEFDDEESLDMLSLRDEWNPTEKVPLKGFSEELRRAKIELGDTEFVYDQGPGSPYAQAVVDEHGQVVLAISFYMLGAAVFRTVDSILPNGKRDIRWRLSGVVRRVFEGDWIPRSKVDGPIEVGSRDLYFFNGLLFSSEPGIGYWRSEDLGKTWDTIFVSWESSFVWHGDTIISFGMPNSDYSYTRASFDRGLTWGPRRRIDASIGKIQFREGNIWGYGLSDGGIGIVQSADFGETWKIVRNEIRPLTDSRIELTSGGGLYLHSARTTEFLVDPTGPWKLCSVASPNWKFDKIRQLGDDIVALSNAAKSGYQWGVLVRFQQGKWQVIRQEVQDFEVSNQRLLAAFVKSEKNLRVNGTGDAGVLVQQECIAALNHDGTWDTLFQDSFTSDCEYGYKGSGPHCGGVYRRMFTNRDGVVFASAAYQPKDSSGARRSFLQSVDAGKSWEAVNSLSDTLPKIDPALFRQDSVYNLYIRRSEEGVGLRRTESFQAVTLQGRGLRIHLAQSGPVQIDLVSPTGAQVALAHQETLAAGDHVFELPKAKGVWYARVRIQRQTETVALPVF